MPALRILILLPVVFALVGCHPAERHAPGFGSWQAGYCGDTPTDLASTGLSSEADLQQFLIDNKIVIVNDVPLAAIHQAVYQYRFQIPDSINEYLVHRGVELHLVKGATVEADPRFRDFREKHDHGVVRDYSKVTGVTYDHTSTVMSDWTTGAANTIAHERGHAVDFENYWRTRDDNYSETADWLAATVEVGTKTALRKLCGAYCDDPEEAFAEVFSIYTGCPASRALLNDSPKTVRFMEKVMADIAEVNHPTPPARVEKQ